MKSSVTYEGFDELITKLQSFGEKQSKSAFRKALRTVTKEVKNKASALAPVDTGAMKNHLAAVSSRSKDKDIIKAAVIVRNAKVIRNDKLSAKDYTKNLKDTSKRKDTHKKRYVYYTPFVEYGTSHSKAKPFLTPATDSIEPFFKPMLEKELKASIKEFNK